MNTELLNASRRHDHSLWLGLALLLTVIGGCANRKGILDVDACADIPAGAIPGPPGSKACGWQEAQASAALVDIYALYQADFIGESDQLSPGALDRIARLNASNALQQQDIILEPSGDAELDQSRVDVVAAVLATSGVEAPNIRLANPPALGLPGPLAEQALRQSFGGRGRGGNIGAPTVNSAFGGTGVGFGNGGFGNGGLGNGGFGVGGF